jgi:hypothetical protein
MADHPVESTVAPAVEVAELELEVQLDEANLQASSLFRMVLGTVVLLVAIVVTLIFVARWQMQKDAEVAAAQVRYPLLEETRAHAETLLQGYGAVDEAAGIYRIPIEKAMEDIVARYGNAQQVAWPQPSAVARP